jgi:hypothetical protein
MQEQKQLITDVEGFEHVEAFLVQAVGKPLKLHMKTCMPNSDETFVVIAGFVHSFEIQTSCNREGFCIQLRKRNSGLFDGTENFYGNFEKFELKTYGISKVLRVLYKDKSFFEIEVFM